MGACIIEKHFMMDRERDKGPDSEFSMEPDEFRAMVDAVRAAEKDPASAVIDERALGQVHYGPSDGDRRNVIFRPSIFVVENMKEGDTFTERTIRIIRPGHGLPPKALSAVLGKKAAHSLDRGTPLAWECVR